MVDAMSKHHCTHTRHRCQTHRLTVTAPSPRRITAASGHLIADAATGDPLLEGHVLASTSGAGVATPTPRRSVRTLPVLTLFTVAAAAVLCCPVTSLQCSDLGLRRRWRHLAEQSQRVMLLPLACRGFDGRYACALLRSRLCFGGARSGRVLAMVTGRQRRHCHSPVAAVAAVVMTHLQLRQCAGCRWLEWKRLARLVSRVPQLGRDPLAP